MSTRSLIAMQIEADKYRKIYCHFDGYLTHNGALLLDHYNSPEKVKELIDVGDISVLAKNLNPDPTRKHGFDYYDRQEDVVVAYGRERGEENCEAEECTFAELDDNIWVDYIYVFTQENKWAYFLPGEAEFINDVETDLNSIYLEKGLSRPNGYYGFLDEEAIEKFKELNQTEDVENEMEVG